VRIVTFVFAVAVILQPTYVLSDEEYVHSHESVEICQVDLTEAGKHANFVGSAVYRVTTNPDGKVESWSEIHVPKMMPGFVDLAAFKCCVERWVLLPSTDYVVSFRCGTSGDALKAWSIGLTRDGHTLKIEIPRMKRGCNETGA